MLSGACRDKTTWNFLLNTSFFYFSQGSLYPSCTVRAMRIPNDGIDEGCKVLVYVFLTWQSLHFSQGEDGENKKLLIEEGREISVSIFVTCHSMYFSCRVREGRIKNDRIKEGHKLGYKVGHQWSFLIPNNARAFNYPSNHVDLLGNRSVSFSTLVSFIHIPLDI